MGKPKIRFKGFDNDWEQRKLGDVLADMYNGQTPSRNKAEFWNGEISWLSSGELNRGTVNSSLEKITEAGQKSANLRIVPKGTFIMAITGLEAAGTRGNCALLGLNTTLNQSCMALFPKKGILDSRFLFQWYRKVGEEYGINYTQGTKQQSYNAELIKILPITLPNVDEQIKISLYLENLDNLITLHQRKCEDTKKLKKYMLQKMSPQNGSKVPEIRFKGFTDDWEQRKLGEIATFINGRAYSQEELLSSGKYKVLRVGNFYTNDSWYFSDLELEDKYYAEEGDLLYTWSATFGPHIWHGDKVIYHYHIWKVGLTENLEKCFAVQLLERDKTAILSDKNGSTMVHITKAGMEEKSVIIPGNTKEQALIGAYFDELDHLITLHQNKCDELKKIKKYMLQNMFV